VPRMDEHELKLAFARALLYSPNAAFNVASALLPDDAGKALKMAHFWPRDPVVIEEQKRILAEEGEEHFLPTRFQLARKVWDTAENAVYDDDKAKLLKLFAEVLGFIEKPNAGSTTNVNIQQNRVMIVKDHGSDSDWEKAAQRQQHALINGEYSRVN
jgi:hypothetical protein